MKKGLDYIGLAVVFLCHNGKGEFVMSRRSKNARDEHGKWDLGGGGLKLGETIEQCLHREIHEEYSTTVAAQQFLGYRDVHRKLDNQFSHWIALDFAAHVDQDLVTIGEPEKIDELKWFSTVTAPPFNERHSGAPAFWEQHQQALSQILNVPVPNTKA